MKTTHNSSLSIPDFSKDLFGSLVANFDRGRFHSTSLEGRHPWSDGRQIYVALKSWEKSPLIQDVVEQLRDLERQKGLGSNRYCAIKITDKGNLRFEARKTDGIGRDIMPLYAGIFLTSRGFRVGLINAALGDNGLREIFGKRTRDPKFGIAAIANSHFYLDFEKITSQRLRFFNENPQTLRLAIFNKLQIDLDS